MSHIGSLIRCPFCRTVTPCRVYDSRPVPTRNETRRRRRCVVCARAFTTYERPTKRRAEAAAPLPDAQGTVVFLLAERERLLRELETLRRRPALRERA